MVKNKSTESKKQQSKRVKLDPNEQPTLTEDEKRVILIQYQKEKEHEHESDSTDTLLEEYLKFMKVHISFIAIVFFYALPRLVQASFVLSHL